MLPAFADWLIRQIAQYGPDFLIPAETKGARLLETVIAYARDVLGTPIDVPVLYATALAYLDPDVLAKSRVMIFDDTVKTGLNLQRNRQRVERYGARHVVAIACIGHVGKDGLKPPVPCWRLADEERYRDYVWQLTELVAARGLPPEVDHHVFTLTLPERLPAAWESLKHELARYGTLSVDAPVTNPEDIVGATLHFPSLPGTTAYPTEGPVHDEGVSKVRLFVDATTGRIFIVPVSFPALDLPPGTPETLPLTDARGWVRRWAQREGSVGELLLDEARTHDPELLLRALSTSAEIDLLCGLVRALVGLFGGGIRLTVERTLFHHLYGDDAGERIAARMEEDIETARAAAGTVAEAPDGETAPPLDMDLDVVETTKRIAIGLKELYTERAAAPDHDPLERVGRSLSEIAASLGAVDRLLVSRCLDYGLAMTTLVPYVDVRRALDGSMQLRRRYRVSESANHLGDYEDKDDIERRMSEETVALIAHHLHEHSQRFASAAVPLDLVGRLAAILQPLALERFAIPLRVRFEGFEPTIMLHDGPESALDPTTSALFREVKDGIVPTAHFEAQYEANRLLLDRRECTIELETWLELLVAIAEAQRPERETDVLLTSWAMSTDLRLGLTHVRTTFELALEELAKPLRTMLRGEAHEASPNVVEHADALLATARAQVARLQEGCALRAQLAAEKPSKRERRLLESFAAPQSTGIYVVPLTLADAIGSLGPLIERLDAASAGLGAEEELGDADRELLGVVLSACRRIERTLTSLGEADDVTAAPALPARAAIAKAAGALLRITRMLRTFARATVGAYLDDARAIRRARDESGERTILFADLSGSFQHAIEHEIDVDFEWKNYGLNIMSQWGKAFGGSHHQDRHGDAIWLGFAAFGDPAAICAAAVQQHLQAFRSVGLDQLTWGAYVVVNHDPLQPADGGGAIGVCLDRAAKLADARKRDARIVERVLLTPEAVERCSPPLQELMTRLDPVTLADVDDPRVHFAPSEIDVDAVMASWRERMSATVASLAELHGPPKPADASGETAPMAFGGSGEVSKSETA